MNPEQSGDLHFEPTAKWGSALWTQSKVRIYTLSPRRKRIARLLGLKVGQDHFGKFPIPKRGNPASPVLN